MKRLIQRLRAAAFWAWRHAAAGVALALILLALLVGYRLGAPAPEPEADPDAATEVAAGEPQMYTCSMHPSVRLPDPDAKCPICFMDLIPVSAGDAGASETQIILSKAAAANSRIETTRVARFFPTATVRLYGKVGYDETSVARLTAYAPGRIERLFVNYVGVPVRPGDHLAELYSPELLASFEELRQAVRSLQGATGLVRETAEDTRVAAREKLRLLGVSEEQIEGVESGEFQGDRLTIYAPIGGVVTHLAVREGDYVETGAPIATVADLSRLWLELQAYESQLPLLRWGQRVSFTVEARPGEAFGGRVSFIEPMVDERTRTAAVRVAVDNADRRLKPGMFASATVRARLAERGVVGEADLAGKWVSPMHPSVVKDEPGACDVCGMDLVPAETLGAVIDPAEAVEPLVIPRSAVLFTGARSLVYVQTESDESFAYEPREVTLGARAGEFYVVRDGLREGDRVVTNGAFRIDSAMQIAGKTSMMSAGRTDDSARPGVDVPRAFIHSLKPIYAAYLDAQEALADDDPSGFAQSVADLATAVGLVEPAALTGPNLVAWRRAAAALRPEHAAADLETARVQFETMSKAVVDLLDRFGHRGSATWRLAHCPMAFENAGADWVQRGETIDNPYFGASMLRCGSIERTFESLGEGADD